MDSNVLNRFLTLSTSPDFCYVFVFGIGTLSVFSQARWCLSSRLGLALVCFFGLMTMTSQRACMRVAIPCMINETALEHEAGIKNGSKTSKSIKDGPSPKSLYKTLQCQTDHALLSPNLTIELPKDGEYLWTEHQQKVIYKTFYWGYLIAQVPAGWFACRFGSRNILGGFMMISSLATIMVPVAANIHYFILLVMRFASGLGAGAVYPCVMALWAKWAPPGERTRLITISFSGSTLGLVLSYPISALLCRYGFAGGWRSIFYVFGGLGCLWTIIWLLYVKDSPIIHRRISRDEKLYILSSLSGETDIEPNTEFHAPWTMLITSLPFLALLICHFTCEWAFYTFETKVPLYMKNVLKVDVQKDPVTWVLPYLGLWAVVLLSGIWADKLRTRAIISTSLVRKIMQSIGTVCPAALLVALGFIDCRQVVAAITIDILGIASMGFQYSGFLVNHLDIYPKYAGVAIALCNSVGAVAELVAPLLVDAITKEKTQNEWQTMFFITAAFLGFSGLCFLTCGTGDLQEWAVCEEYEYDSSSNNCDSASDYESNDVSSSDTDDSNDVISGETVPMKKSSKSSSNDLNARPRKKIPGRSPERQDKVRKKSGKKLNGNLPDLPEFITTSPPPRPVRLSPSADPAPLLTPVTPTQLTPPPLCQDNTIPDGTSVPGSKFDDLANLLSHYDTLPARGRDRSVTPTAESTHYVNQPRRSFSPPPTLPAHQNDSLDYARHRSSTRSPSPYPADTDYSLPHSVLSESPYDTVAGTMTPHSQHSRQPSPGNYASLQRASSPDVASLPLSRHGSARFPSRAATPHLTPTGSRPALEAGLATPTDSQKPSHSLQNLEESFV